MGVCLTFKSGDRRTYKKGVGAPTETIVGSESDRFEAELPFVISALYEATPRR
jgi:hypothetical protein